MQKSVTTLALALVAAAASIAAARAGESAPQQQHVEKIVIRHGGNGGDAKTLPDPSQIPGDHVKIDDLASLAAGESRTYTSEGGKDVVVTRLEGEAERYTLTANGHTMPIGGDPMLTVAGLPGGAEEKRIVIRHEKKADANGEVTEDVETTGGPDVDIVTAAGDGPPPLVIEIDGEKDGKVTRQVIVLREKEEKKQR
jgi:hypothetical protein